MIEHVETSIRGHRITTTGVRVSERTVIVLPGLVKTAEIMDEAWLEDDAAAGPGACVEHLRRANLKADLFTFFQKLPNVAPRYPYFMEWDNVAAIPTADVDEWWRLRIPTETRKNVKRASKRGVVIREVGFDDELLRGIVAINNETPVRQGRRFWHYGKSVAEVERDYSTLVDRSGYLGAYYGTELIGLIKLVYMGEIASILQLLCKPSHYDKRPSNALIARAVELCHARGLTHLVYGQYTYGSSTWSPLAEFKRRNGFELRQCPRYYIPLTVKGRLALSVGLHRGWRPLIPETVMQRALWLRGAWYGRPCTCRAAPVCRGGLFGRCQRTVRVLGDNGAALPDWASG
jgi:hypothetical protein